MIRSAGLVAAIGILWAGMLALPAGAQHVLTAGSETVLPGSPVSASILLNNPDPVRGFSLGMTHDGVLLTLNTITEGAQVLAANGGTGPDFWFTDVAPLGGPGGTCGCVLSTGPPLDEIPIGAANEIALYNYSAAAAAPPAAISPLDFSGALGSPAIEIVIDVAGTSNLPLLNSGQVLILTPPVSNLTCTLTDICTCEFSLSWTNGMLYDSIEVHRDGLLVATLLGGATSHVLNLPAPGTSTLTVTGIKNLQAADSIPCVADCPVVPPPVSPDAFTCTVDHFTKDVTVTWSNPQVYTGLEIRLDGVLVQSLPGTATSAIVSLPSPGSYQICIDGTDICDTAFPQICCTAVLEQLFWRGDANSDGSHNISDPITMLSFLFLSEPVECVSAIDVNDDEGVNLADVVYDLNAIFGTGPLPPLPFPDCGLDPTPGPLTCATFTPCP